MCIEVWQAKIEQKCYVGREHSIYKCQTGSLGGRLGDGDSCAGVFFIFVFLQDCPWDLYLLKGERGSKYSERERENLSYDSAPTKSSADPKESSGAGMAIGDVLSRGMEARTSRLSVDQSWMQVVLWKKMEP